MFGRIVVLAAALTIAHLLTVTLCVGAYVGAARYATSRIGIPSRYVSSGRRVTG